MTFDPRPAISTPYDAMLGKGTAVGRGAYDAIILELMDAMNETTDSVFPRHANLE